MPDYISGFLGSLCAVYNVGIELLIFILLHVASLYEVGLDMALDSIWFIDVS